MLKKNKKKIINWLHLKSVLSEKKEPTSIRTNGWELGIFEFEYFEKKKKKNIKYKNKSRKR